MAPRLIMFFKNILKLKIFLSKILMCQEWERVEKRVAKTVLIPGLKLRLKGSLFWVVTVKIPFNTSFI
jgi:hypothetical protein